MTGGLWTQTWPGWVVKVLALSTAEALEPLDTARSSTSHSWRPLKY